MKETFERSLWAFLICILCVLLAILFTFTMLSGSSGSDRVIAEFTADAAQNAAIASK